MFAAYGRNTLANTKPYVKPATAERVVDLVQLRRERAALRDEAAEQKKLIEAQREVIQREKAVADDLIARAKAASQAIRQREREVAKQSLCRRIAALQTQLEVMDDVAATDIKRTPYKVIEQRICRALKVEPSDVYSARRDRDIAFARQAIAYWACRLTGFSLPQVGRIMNRDHTTVLHAKRIYPEKRAKQGRYLRVVL